MIARPARLAAARAVLLAASVPLSALAGDLRVSPPQASTTVEPGQPASFSLQLVSGADTLVKPGFADFDLDETGEPVRGSAGPRSCAARARTNPEEVRLRAREPQVVRVRVELPPDARGTYWCFVTFDLKPGAPEPGRGTVVRLAPRLSVPLFVTVGAGSSSHVSTRFFPPEKKGGQVVSTLWFENTGPALVRLAGEVSLEETDDSPTEVGQQQVSRFLLLPEHRRRVDVRIPKPGSAPTRLKGVFDAEGSTPSRVIVESPPIS